MRSCRPVAAEVLEVRAGGRQRSASLAIDHLAVPVAGDVVVGERRPDRRCGGTLLPALPSSNSTPTVQLLVICSRSPTVLSVGLRKIIPVRLSLITLLWTTVPVLLLMSIAVRFPVKVLLRISARPLAFTDTPAVFSGSFHVAGVLPARVMVNPSITTLAAVT